MSKFAKKALAVIASVILFMSLAGGSVNADPKPAKRPTRTSSTEDVNKKDQIKSQIEHLKRELKRLKDHQKILSNEYNHEENLLNRLQNKLNS